MRTTLVGNLKELGRRALAGALSGFVWGFVIGGAGGRLAMFVLRVTTGDSVKGVESDDGFIIGSFTSDTLFLLAAATFAGAAIGVFYVLVRGWLPEKHRALLVAAFFGLAGGAAVIRPGGVDFTLLKPLPLAMAMFVLLPALYGFAMSLTAEKLLLRLEGSVASWAGVAAGGFALIGMGLGSIGGLVLVLLLVVLFVGASAAGRNFDWIRRVSSLPAVVWSARGILVAVAGFAAVALVRDFVQIL